MTTEAPSNPRRSAMPKPMPCVEAETITTFPSNLFAIFISMPIKFNARQYFIKQKKLYEGHHLSSSLGDYANNKRRDKNFVLNIPSNYIFPKLEIIILYFDNFNFIVH